MGQHGIIIITKGEPLAAAMLQAKVARSADARIGLFQHPDAAIFFGQFMGQRSTAIGGAIVHQQQLKIRKALAQHAFHSGMQQHPGIIDRHDNTDQWGLLHTVHLPFGLWQHRTIPALRLKHRSGSCGTASALPKCSIRHPVLSALLAWHLPHLARRIGT